MVLTSTASAPSPSVWRGRRVLITGHTGFKGAWMSLWLKRLGAVVTGLALEPDTDPSLYSLLALDSDVTSLIGNICDPKIVSDAFAAAAPEIVIHMAAQSLVRRSYVDPVGTYMTNVMGTAHVLEAIRRGKTARAALIVTSDKCYENREQNRAYREGDPMGGFDPYSSSKGCAELLTSSWRRSFLAGAGVRVASARAGNVIGGGDWSTDRLVPDIMRAFAAGTPAAIRNPGAVRPWQHVLDPLAGYLTLLERLWGAADASAFAKGYNFGPREDDIVSVAAVAEACRKKWGGAAETRNGLTPPGSAPHEAGLLKLDCSLARDELGWRPRLPLDEALDLTVDWYKRFSQGEDVRAVSAEQFEAWEAA